MSKNKLCFIVGTTASGKSSLAFEYAQSKAPNVEIVNMDSIQSYKELDIGSAKPTAQEQEMVPHHLFSCVDFNNELTAGKYHKLALKVIDQRLSQVQLLFVGGSGFYMQALDKGMYEGVSIPEADQIRMRAELEVLGYEKAYKWIQEVDLDYSTKISPNDHYRIQRAFEMLKYSTKTVTQIKQDEQERVDRYQQDLNYSKVKVGLFLEKEELLKNVKYRIKTMLKNGFIEEVECLLAKGYKGWNPLSSVGYKELAAHLSGEISLEDAEEQMVRATMKLAKKQKTWFQRDSEIRWFHGIDGRQSCLHYLESSLGESL